MRSRTLVGLLSVLGAFVCVVTSCAKRLPDRVTVPLLVEGNRPFIELTFRRADGSTRAARFLLDTGGGGFLLTEMLARDLGLVLGESSTEGGQTFATVKNAPTVFLGAFPLDLNPKRVAVIVGSDNMLPKAAPGRAEGMIPGHILSRYHVVFDYPNATFTLARPGVLTPIGDALRMPVAKQSGFPRTEIDVNDVKYGMLIDTGASFTMVSEVLLQALGRDHPEWPRHTGAFGEAATLGGMTLETMFLPRVSWGSQQLQDMGIVSQRAGTFERYMSGMMTAPIIGSLAGNVLKNFRVELDYAHETLYLSK